VEGWERASRDFLRLDPEPFPWTLMLGRSCAWHVRSDSIAPPDTRRSALVLRMSGRDLSVYEQPHEGSIELPSGKELRVSGVAFGSVYTRKDGDAAPFFVLALPEVWRMDPKAAADPRLDSIILGVFSHEVVHTRQLALVSRRVEELQRRFTLPEDLTDDIIQERFGKNAAFAAAYEEEAALFYRATAAGDPAERRHLTRQALALADARRAKYFRDANAGFAELEALFLNMEGIACWVAYQLSRVDPRFDIGMKDPAADRARNTWSQDEGLALLLLVDSFVPDWRQRMLGEELASPFTLLEEALGPGRADGGRASPE
jgi:hypothetical protein